MDSPWYPSPAELPAYVSGVIADVDGFTPAPYGVAARLGSTTPAVYLTPDRRARSSVLVGLSVSTAGAPGETRRDAWLSLLSLTVGGVELVEGAVPVAALLGGDNACGLQAPVVQSPSTPLVLRASPLDPDVVSPVIDVMAVYLSCSVQASRRVSELLGARARWWGVGPADGRGLEGYLNVERAGRALAFSAATALADDAQPSAATSAVVTLERDGRAMMAPYAAGPLGDLTEEGYPHAVRAFAHEVRAGSIYRSGFANTAPFARALAWFSGVEKEG